MVTSLGLLYYTHYIIITPLASKTLQPVYVYMHIFLLLGRNQERFEVERKVCHHPSSTVQCRCFSDSLADPAAGNILRRIADAYRMSVVRMVIAHSQLIELSHRFQRLRNITSHFPRVL